MGSLGQHHARIYAALPGAVLAGIFEPSDARAAEICAKHGCRRFATLEELGIVEPGAAKRILRTLDGAALESYWSDGRQYRITVRARDKKRTRYEMDIAGIRESQNQN